MATQSIEDSIITADEFEHRVELNAKIEEGRVRKPVERKADTMLEVLEQIDYSIESLLQTREGVITAMCTSIDPFDKELEFVDKLDGYIDTLEFYKKRELRREYLYDKFKNDYVTYATKVRNEEDYEPFKLTQNGQR